MWLCRTGDRYYVALDEAKGYLGRIGVPRKQLGLDASAIVILISAGGYGIGPIEQLVKDLLALQQPWQIVAIAGKSEKTKKRLEEMAREAGKLQSGSPRLCAVGFTSEMDKYMAAADLMVGKAGGLTTSE